MGIPEGVRGDERCEVGAEQPISHLTELHLFGDDFYRDFAPNGARIPFGDWNRPRSEPRLGAYLAMGHLRGMPGIANPTNGNPPKRTGIPEAIARF
jgi:hypothetical protein